MANQQSSMHSQCICKSFVVDLPLSVQPSGDLDDTTRPLHNPIKHLLGIIKILPRPEKNGGNLEDTTRHVYDPNKYLLGIIKILLRPRRIENDVLTDLS